ncbi:MAG: hypothetical protein JWL72_3425 [Ilumatobacteraceae bacterium]|nr:hypothetical protein [Ilumatobacteraceae bacterium]
MGAHEQTTSTSWVVSVTMDGAVPDDADAVADTVRRTRALRASAVFVMDGSVYARLDVEADSVAAAIVLVDDLLLDVIGDAWVPVAIIAESKEVRDAGGLSQIPPLAGLAEVADLLGITSAEASLAVCDPGFPTPVSTLASGCVWTRSEVETFARLSACRRASKNLSRVSR